MPSSNPLNRSVLWLLEQITKNLGWAKQPVSEIPIKVRILVDITTEENGKDILLRREEVTDFEYDLLNVSNTGYDGKDSILLSFVQRKKEN